MTDFDFNASNSPFFLIGLLLLTLAGLQLSGIYRQLSALSSVRLRWRIGLNLLLWFAILGMVLQPKFLLPTRSRKAFLAGRDLPATIVQTILDSLGDVRELNLGDPLPDGIDTLVLSGKDFPDDALYRLTTHKNHPVIQWIPYHPEGTFRNLQWDAITRLGTSQEVNGQIRSARGGLVKVMLGAKILDTVRVDTGTRQFKLKFPVPSVGRNAVVLWFNEQSLDTLHFYGMPAEPYTVRFVLAGPDFETNALAGWLGKQGNASVYDVPVSTGIARNVKINETAEPSVFVVDVTAVNNVQVEKAFLSGKSVLVWGLTDPVSDVKKINRTFGTSFKTRRISTKESIVIQPELTAQPFEFVVGNRSIPVGKLPVEIQKGAGTVAVSLLNETFPLLLSGDSTRYSALWQSMLAQLRPPPKRMVAIAAPIGKGVNADVEVKGLPLGHRTMFVGADSVSLRASALNSHVSQIPVMFQRGGWQKITTDSLDVEMYVENAQGGGSVHLNSILEAYDRKAVSKRIVQTSKPVPVPDWIWFVLIVGILTVLWIEPKL